MKSDNRIHIQVLTLTRVTCKLPDVSRLQLLMKMSTFIRRSGWSIRENLCKSLDTLSNVVLTRY